MQRIAGQCVSFSAAARVIEINEDQSRSKLNKSTRSTCNRGRYQGQYRSVLSAAGRPITLRERSKFKI
jgi:hypothetical protein